MISCTCNSVVLTVCVIYMCVFFFKVYQVSKKDNDGEKKSEENKWLGK